MAQESSEALRDRLYTPPQLAEVTGIGEKLLRSEIQAGRLPAYRVSPRGYYRIRWSDYEAWLREHVAVPRRPDDRAHARRVVREVRARQGATD